MNITDTTCAECGKTTETVYVDGQYLCFDCLEAQHGRRGAAAILDVWIDELTMVAA